MAKTKDSFLGPNAGTFVTEDKEGNKFDEIDYAYDAPSGDLTLVIHTKKYPDRMTASGKNRMLSSTGAGVEVPGISTSKLQLNLYAKK